MRNPKVDRVGKIMIRIERSKSRDWLSDDWTPLIAPLWPSSTPSCRICVTVKSASHKPTGYSENWLSDDYFIIYSIIYNYSSQKVNPKYKKSTLKYDQLLATYNILTCFNTSRGRRILFASALIYYFRVNWHYCTQKVTQS